MPLRIVRQYSKACNFERVLSSVEDHLAVKTSTIRDVLKYDLMQAQFTFRLKQLLVTSQPFLNTVNSLYLSAGGKRIRPLLVLLLSNALNADPGPLVEQKCQKLALISELIHTASLMHDDILDGASLRRHGLSANYVFGNKAAVLSGDYLLAKASLELASIGNLDVVSSMSQIIADLVHGEFMQLETTLESASDDKLFSFEYYLEKSFRKTGSLLANSCKSVALLHESQGTEKCHEFGKLFGLLFQLVDDKLDFSTCDIGKPLLQDLSLGLPTAPIYFALEKYPNLKTLLRRKCSEPGDANQVLESIHDSKAIEATDRYCHELYEKAVKSLDFMKESEGKTLLIELTESMIHRKQ